MFKGGDQGKYFCRYVVGCAWGGWGEGGGERINIVDVCGCVEGVSFSFCKFVEH